MKKVFTVAFIRDVYTQWMKGEISSSRVAEILNEKAFDEYIKRNNKNMSKQGGEK